MKNFLNAMTIFLCTLLVYINILTINESTDELSYLKGKAAHSGDCVLAADLGFYNVSSSKIEAMNYVFPEIVASTGTQTMVLITNPAWNLNAGTTYYSMGANSIMTSDPTKNSMTITQGKYVHAIHYVNYWVSMSSAVGQ